MGRPTVTTFIALLFLALVLFELGRFGAHLWQARQLAAAGERYERRPGEAGRWLLVVGDSTAVGIGAGEPEQSVAGRLAQRFPGLAVVNLGVVGARMGDLPAQLEAAPERDYDAVLIQAGGNDVLAFTGLVALRESTARVLELAGRHSDYTVMMSTGDVGGSPAFPMALDWLLSARTRAVREVLMAEAAKAGAHYVDLYRPPQRDPFVQEPRRYFAGDGLHPSGAGYGLWAEELLAQSALEDRLRKD